MESQEIAYMFNIWYGGKWVDSGGSRQYEGQLEAMNPHHGSISYEQLSCVAEVYCGLLEHGSLLYLPPNGNPQTDLEVISADEDLQDIPKKQGATMMINIYVMPPFNLDECSKDPFLMQLRNKVVRHRSRIQRAQGVGVVIGASTVDKGKKIVGDALVDKGKKKIEETSIQGYTSDDDYLYDLRNSPFPYSDDLEDGVHANRVIALVEDSIGVEEAAMRKKRGKQSKRGGERSDYVDVNIDVEDNVDLEEATMRKKKWGKKGAKWPCEVPGFGEDNVHECRSDTLEDTIGADVADDATSGKICIYYKEEKDGANFNLQLGMLFGSAAIYRKAMREHAILNGYDIVMPVNNKKRIEIYCKKDCGFKVIARCIDKENTIQIRELVKTHQCQRDHYNHNVDKKWICDNYIEMMRDDRKVRNGVIRGDISRRFGWKVNRFLVSRAMKLAKEELDGDRKEEYAKIRDYAATLLEHNPGSTVVLGVDSISSSLRPKFERLYVCLEACVSGLKNGCRPFIGLDGCFLKGPDGGQLLCAVTRDADNALFPVAFAWVEAENLNSWRWFIELLASDIGNDRTWTLMSDRQKGLRRAVQEILPGAEHRYCMRHIWLNMQVGGMGSAEVRRRAWSAACAYTYQRHKWHMDRLKVASKKAWEYLSAIDTNAWCRYQFRPASKTDLVVNNIAESFNKKVLDAREKPPVSLVEDIRKMLMRDFEKKRKTVVQQHGQLGKEVVKKLKLITEGISGCKVIYAAEGEYEVETSPITSYKTNIHARTCTCRAWELSGLPCVHAIACLVYARIFELAPYCDPVYHKAAYIATYAGVVHALPGRDDWVQTSALPIDPPIFRARSGRPKKKRERSAFEHPAGTSTKLSKSGLKQSCSICGETGHNKRGCDRRPAQSNANGKPSRIIEGDVQEGSVPES